MRGGAPVADRGGEDVARERREQEPAVGLRAEAVAPSSAEEERILAAFAAADALGTGRVPRSSLLSIMRHIAGVPLADAKERIFVEALEAMESDEAEGVSYVDFVRWVYSIDQQKPRKLSAILGSPSGDACSREEVVAAMGEAFDAAAWDAAPKSDGKISRKDLGALVAKQSVRQLASAMAECWLNPASAFQRYSGLDGVIDIQEFSDLLVELKVPISGAVAMEAFAAMDTDGSGSISTAEFARALWDAGVEVHSAAPAEPGPAPDPTERFVSLVAHNEMKPAMMQFVARHLPFFARRRIVTTGSTGRALEQSLGLRVAHKVASGPIGGDQDIGGMISRNEVAAVFFFQDPLTAHPHWADIVALNRLCNVHNVLTASNPVTAAAALYAIENSPASTNLLSHCEPAQSDVVSAYKARQASVIAAVASAGTAKS